MTGQDKKTTEGKIQVLRRLNKGMEFIGTSPWSVGAFRIHVSTEGIRRVLN